MQHSDRTKIAPVPSGQLTRFWHLGRAAGGLAGAAATRALSGLLKGEQAGASALALTPEDARRLAERLSRMRGAVMKLGQLLSLDGNDVLPPEFVRLLAPLRSDAHTMPFSQLVTVLDTEYGKGWKSDFRRLDFKPIAAASIGQVHAAETADGRKIALKVQYPGVRESIDSDIDNLSLLARTFRILPPETEIGALLEEARAQLHREADYAAEASALTSYRDRLGEDPDLFVPAVIPELSTSRILAMEFAEGVVIDRLVDADRRVREHVATTLSRLVLRELYEIGLAQTDPNFANYLYDANTGRIALLDFGAAQAVQPALAEGFRALARAAIALDRTAARDAIFEIGYLDERDRQVHIDGLVELSITAAEPLRHDGSYDFARSDLFSRAREMGQKLVVEHGFGRKPPPETTFLHRKFIGAFMMCSRLRARVDLAAIAAPWLN